MFKRFFLYLLPGLCAALCSCVRSGETTCYSYVKFVYDYNMAFEDLFHNQACKMDLYLFDDNGVFVDVISDQRAEGTFERNYRILLPEGLPYPLHFVAWSGVHDQTCRATDLIPGVSSREELIVHMREREDHLFDGSLRGLWHGTASKMAENTGIREEETIISLTKNTNSLRIVLQVLDSDRTIDVDDFTFTLECVNGSYDHNNAVHDDHNWLYRPFFTANDAGVGAIAEIHTLRLMENTKNNLTIHYTPLNYSLIDIDLNRYINALKLQSYDSMPLQEYMDREDEYRVVVFLKFEKECWIAADVSINDWYVREQTEGE